MAPGRFNPIACFAQSFPWDHASADVAYMASFEDVLDLGDSRTTLLRPMTE